MLLICLPLARARSSLRLHLHGVRTFRRSAQSPAENQRGSNVSQRKDVLLLALIICRRQVPEPYLWLIFRAQIEALHAMHYGHVLTADTPPEHIAMQNPNWLPIINPDIRLGNAVLGDAQDRYPAYQTVKMIDFGHAFRCEEITDKTKMMGTRYICPPVGTAVKLFQHALTLRQEQWRDENNKLLEAYRHVPIGLHSEIYNVGLIMLSLMKGEEQRMPSPGDIFWHLPAPNRCYSSQLHATVISCMRTEHKQRPTVKQLLQLIKYGLEAWEQSYGSADRKDLPEFMRYDLHASEHFAIGEKAPSD
jgi:serine/threonine protein kinase